MPSAVGTFVSRRECDSRFENQGRQVIGSTSVTMSWSAFDTWPSLHLSASREAGDARKGGQTDAEEKEVAMLIKQMCGL